MPENSKATVQAIKQDTHLSLPSRPLKASTNPVESHTHLDLSWNHLYKLTPQKLSELQKKFARPLSHLDLSDNFIHIFDEQQTACLSSFITICAPNTLNLSGLLFHEYPLKQYLLGALSALPSLSTLILSRAELTTSHECLSETLSYLSQIKLTALNLSKNEFWQLNEQQWQAVITYINQAKLDKIHFASDDIRYMPTNAKLNFIAALKSNNTQLISADLTPDDEPLLYDYAHPTTGPFTLFHKDFSTWTNGYANTEDTYISTPN